MKSIKYLIFCNLVFLFSAQHLISQKYSIGLTGGLGSSIAHSDGADVDPSIAFKAGMFLTVPMDSNFELWTSVNYTHISWERKKLPDFNFWDRYY